MSRNWIPEPGDTWKQRVSLGIPDVGPSGENVTWDFTDAINSGVFGEITFNWTDPVQTPYIDSFPDATVAAFLSFGGFGNSYGYYRDDGSAFSYLGQGNNFGFTILLDPQELRYIDLNYGSMVDDDYLSVRITSFSSPDTVMGYTLFEYDAYGTLILGDEEIQDAIRIVQLDTEGDSTTTPFGLTTVIRDTIMTYAWIAEGSVFPVAQWQRTKSISRTYLNGELFSEEVDGPDTTFAYNPDYGTSTATTAVERLPSFLLAPNVTSDRFELRSDGRAGLPFSIFDLSGKTVFTGRLQGPVTTVDISGLSPGYYAVRLEGYMPQVVIKAE